MHQRRHLLYSVIACLSVPFPAFGSPNALPPPVVPQCVGIDMPLAGQSTPDFTGTARIGVGWVRVDVLWSSIEKTRGAYDFSSYDSLLTGLAARHIKPLLTLNDENDLYGTGPPVTHEARVAFVAFAAAAARHSRGKTILWELETGPMGTLALTTAQAMKAADPNTTLVVSATPGFPLTDLTALFQQGLLRDVDAIAVQPPVGSSPEGAADTYQAMRLLLHRYAPPGKDVPLISVASADTTLAAMEPQHVARQVLSDLAEGVRLSIRLGLPDADTGPAFLAARTLTRTLQGCRFLKRIPLFSPGDYLLLFGHGPNVQKLVAWTTGQTHVVSLPVPRVAFVTDMLGKSEAPSIVQGRLRLTLTGSPLYLDVPANAALRQAAAWTVQPLDAIYTDGQPLRLALSYHDPDAVSHRIRFRIALMTPDGARTPMLSGEDIVGPQQSLTLGTASATLSRRTVRARVGLVVDGVRQPYPQDVMFTPADPLALTVVSLSPTTAQAQIVNPGGTAFVGHLSAAGPKGIVTIPIHLGIGQTALMTSVSCPAGVAWRLRDVQGRLVASLPARRLGPLLVAPPVPGANRSPDPHLP